MTSLAACAAGHHVSHGVGRVAERVGLLAHVTILAVFRQFDEALEDGVVLFGAEGVRRLAD